MPPSPQCGQDLARQAIAATRTVSSGNKLEVLQAVGLPAELVETSFQQLNLTVSTLEALLVPILTGIANSGIADRLKTSSAERPIVQTAEPVVVIAEPLVTDDCLSAKFASKMLDMIGAAL